MLNRSKNKVSNNSKPNWIKDKSVLIMEKAFLTNGGNLLRFDPTGRRYFQKPNGEFIREVSDSEGDFLSQHCLEISISFPPEHPDFLPTWHFIKSILVVEDNSNYKWETSRNGGNYSFQTYHDWYVAKYPNGEWKFAYVESNYTSAEISYDELTGSFQSDLGYLYLSNAADNKNQYQSQAGIEWINGEKIYGVDEVLEKIATMSCFEDMWNEVYFHIPCKWDEEEYTDPANQCSALSFTDKKEIFLLLKGLGMTKQDKKPSIRGQRRGRR